MMSNKSILCFILFFSTQLFAETTKLLVVIKQPSINAGISKEYLKYIDLNIIRSEMVAALTATQKFFVLPSDQQPIQPDQDAPGLAQSDTVKVNAAGQNHLHYVIAPTVQDFKLLRKNVPLPDSDNKFTRRDYGLLALEAQMINASDNRIVNSFSLNTSFAGKETIATENSDAPDQVHFTEMVKKVAAKLSDQLVASVFTETQPSISP